MTLINKLHQHLFAASCGKQHSEMLQIVAGLEAEATNLFLQMLARAATGQQQASKPKQIEIQCHECITQSSLTMQATSSSLPLASQAATQAASSAQPTLARTQDSTPQTHQSPSAPKLGLQAQARHHVLSNSAALHCVSHSSPLGKKAGVSLATHVP